MKRLLILALLVASPALALAAKPKKTKEPPRPLTYAEKQQAVRDEIAKKNAKKRATADKQAERDFEERAQEARSRSTQPGALKGGTFTAGS